MRAWNIRDINCSENEDFEDILNEMEFEGKKIQNIIQVSPYKYKVFYTYED